MSTPSSEPQIYRHPIAQTHAFLDGQIVLLLSAAKAQGFRPTCKAGCSFCCFEPCYVIRQEVEYLISQHDPSRLAALKERVADWYGKFLLAELDKAPPPDETTASMPFYRSKNIPCPLLENSTRCAMYVSRPISCRSHFAIGPVARCRNPQKRSEQKFLQPDPYMLASCMGILSENAPRFFFESDHLGVWLAILLGIEGAQASAAHRIVDVTQTHPL